MKTTILSTLSLVSLAAALPAPAQMDSLATSCQAYPWFIAPRYASDCSGDQPAYNPTSGDNLVNATCRPLTNNPATQEGPFLAADVTIACGGYAVTLYNSTDCSDTGVSSDQMEACVPAPKDQQFVRFSAVQTGPLSS